MKSRPIKSSKAKKIIKRFEDEDERAVDEQIGEDQQEEEEHSEQVVERKTKQSLKSIFSNVLQKQPQGSVAVLAEKQQLLNQIKEEKKKKKEEQLSKKIKKVTTVKAHCDPRVQTNAALERQLKVAAAKGIVKVFQIIKQVRQEAQEEE